MRLGIDWALEVRGFTGNEVFLKIYRLYKPNSQFQELEIGFD